MEIPSRVGIVGLGLMGGSLARALGPRAAGPSVMASSLVGEDLVTALSHGVVDEVGDPETVAASCDLVVYATPLTATLRLLEAHAERWKPGAVITDLVSLKSPVQEQARRLGILARYVGSHPMAGGEGSGYPASRDGLYHDATVWLVRDGASEAAAATVRGLWEAVGGRPVWVGADEHDRRMVRTSHLPQVVANALAAVLGEAGLRRSELGPGGREMTRLAGSSPEMWRPLLRYSGPELAGAVREILPMLETVARLLEDGDVDAVVRLMERTGRWTRGEPWS